MKFTVDEISSVISEEIKNFRSEVDLAEVGRVLELGDGIARVYGLTNAMAGEQLQFANGQFGQVFNLEESSVGVVIFGNYLDIREGDEVRLFAVPSDAPGLQREALATMDQTRRQARVVLDDVRLPEDALMSGGEAALEKTLQLAAVALSAEQVGGAQRCLDAAVEYAKERVQFGRPIGSFQAIKHKCADMMVLVESARSASYYAGCVAAEDTEELPVVASLAQAVCSDAYFRCAAESLQIHGGVGFTWEYDVHLYFKRAKSSETFLGDAAWHRERVATMIGL